MKRSEAIAVILKELNNNFEKSKTICPTSLDFNGIAHDILFRLEALGMLPPSIETKIFNRQDNDYYMENEWEKE